MRVASRACALGCLVAAVALVRPTSVSASMTMALRDEQGHTITFYQDGSHIRIGNPTGIDDGEARIIDLKTTEHVIVYDDAKSYYDYNKTLAQMRAAIQHLDKEKKDLLERARAKTAVSFRALGETRHVNGFSCAMHDRVVDGRVEGQVCLAAWGRATGAPEDFAWFDALAQRLIGEVAGPRVRAAVGHFSVFGGPEGLPVWSSSTKEDGSKEQQEIAKLSREPLPPEMFHVPPDYKEFSRPLTASEHPKIGPPPMDDARPRRRATTKVSGLAAIILAFAVIVGLLIHAALLHLAASLVLEHARFLQAFVATIISAGMLVVVRLLGLPPVLAGAFGVFTVFAAVKISYGASIGRTLALFFVSGLISAAIGLLARALMG